MANLNRAQPPLRAHTCKEREMLKRKERNIVVGARARIPNATDAGNEPDTDTQTLANADT
eukprot:7196191-Alexandrium_andersonii.AAC.1